jgi:phosphohistidine swiveling domain-containing protein
MQTITSDYLHAFDQIPIQMLAHVGTKAANLVTLSRAGLPVPYGYCIADSVHQEFQRTGVVPASLIDDIRTVRHCLGGSIAIRSSANCEDGHALSMAGVFETKYVLEQDDIEEAIKYIYEQSTSESVEQFMGLHGRSLLDMKMGLIVQKLVIADASGVVYTRINGDLRLIQYVDGFGNTLADGESAGNELLADRNGRVMQARGMVLSVDVVRQLMDAVAQVEQLFPGLALDIEFACRGGDIFILQARPLTTDLGTIHLQETAEECLAATKKQLKALVEQEKCDMGTATAIFSDANYSELLPRPTEMDIGLYTKIFTGSQGQAGATQNARTEMGYLNGPESIGIISYIGGRTYFSIARNAALYYVGFPATQQEYFSSLVTEYLDVIRRDPDRGSYPQMGLYLQVPSLDDLERRFGAPAKEYYRTYLEFASQMTALADRFIDVFEHEQRPAIEAYIAATAATAIDDLSSGELVERALSIMAHLRDVTCVSFVKAARLGFYYSQRLSTILEHYCDMPKERAIEVFSRLTQGLDGSAITQANIEIACAADADAACRIARGLIGHYSTGEMLEIRHPRLSDDASALRSYVDGIREGGGYIGAFEAQRAERQRLQAAMSGALPDRQGIEFEHVANAAQTYMALRETVKYLLTKEYSLIKDCLELLGERIGLSAGDIYFFYPHELAELARDPQALRFLIGMRRQSFSNYAQLDMPSVIREEDIDALGFKGAANEDLIEVVGKFLADGPACEGYVVNVNTCDSLEQARRELMAHREHQRPAILVATQLNLSHDPLIALASGLIIENAGIVSHGAQRARELGKGAIGGIRTRLLTSGTKVFFDPGARLVRKVD